MVDLRIPRTYRSLRKPYYNGVRMGDFKLFFGRPPITFDLRSRVVEGVRSRATVEIPSPRNVRQAGTVYSREKRIVKFATEKQNRKNVLRILLAHNYIYMVRSS